MGFVQNHSLSIVTLGAFLVIWMGAQAWSGHRAYNDDQRARDWEFEFLQMGVYVLLLTAWLVQKGLIRRGRSLRSRLWPGGRRH